MENALDKRIAHELGAALVVEIGSSTTRVTLVDSVAGETRLIGRKIVGEVAFIMACATLHRTPEQPFSDAVSRAATHLQNLPQ